MSEPIVGGRFRRAELAALRAAGCVSELNKIVLGLQRQIDAMSHSVGTDLLHATSLKAGTLIDSLSVTAGKLVDGYDVSVLGATSATHTSDIAALDTRLDTAEADITVIEGDIVDLSTFAANTGYDYLDAFSFDNRDARTVGYSNAKGFIQATDAATSRYHTTWLVPRTITASTNLTVKLHWLVAAAGGTAGQDVVWRLNTAFTANGESTSTSSATLDTTVDTPTITADTFYITTLTTTLSGAVAGDNMTIEIDRRGSDGADTLTATAGFVGVEISWTPDYS